MAVDFDVPEEQHQQMRALEGQIFVEHALAQLYYCAMKCQKGKVLFPEDLDQAHALLWKHLGRPEEDRRLILYGPSDAKVL